MVSDTGRLEGRAIDEGTSGAGGGNRNLRVDKKLFAGGGRFFHEGLDGFWEGIFFVRRMEIKVNSAERTRVVALAQDDGDFLVQRDTVAQTCAALLVSLDDVMIKILYGLFDFTLECFDGHQQILINA